MIDFAAMNNADRKAALVALLNALPSSSDRKEEAKELLKYQKVTSVVEFLTCLLYTSDAADE